MPRRFIQSIPFPAVLITVAGEVCAVNNRWNSLGRLAEQFVPVVMTWTSCPFVKRLAELAMNPAAVEAQIVRQLEELSWRNDRDEAVTGVFQCSVTYGAVWWSYRITATEQLGELHYLFTVATIGGAVADEDELARLVLVSEKTKSAVIITDTHRRIQWTNAAFSALSGYSLDEVKGKVPGHFLHGPETNQTTVNKIRDALAEFKPSQTKILNYSRSGQPYWIDLEIHPIYRPDGSLQGFLGIQTDITEQQRSLALQTEVEKRWELVLKANGDGVWDWQISSNKVVFSERWKAILGYSREELTDHFGSWVANVHPEDLPAAMDRVQACISGQSDLYDSEFRMRHKNGSWRWIRARAVPVRDDSGALVRLVGSHVDITEQRENEERLICSNATLEEQNALIVAQNNEIRRTRNLLYYASQASNRFLTQVGDEFRTPLNGILGMLEIVLGMDPSDGVKENVELARLSAESLLRLLQDVLDFSKIETGALDLEVKRFSLSSLIERVTTFLNRQISDRRLTYEFQIHRDVPDVVLGDEVRCAQMLLNLLSTASSLATVCGAIILYVDLDASWCTRESISGTLPLHIRVATTGSGISEGILNALFDPFAVRHETDPQMTAAHVLSLPIVSRLVDLMGGAIKAKTRSRIGTLFEAWIPLSVEAAAETSGWQPQASQPTAAGLPPKGSFTGMQVLVVEDNFVNQRVLVQLLSQLGALATPVNDGIEALDLLGKDKDRFDVVFMDCQMPRLDGYETTRAVRLQERTGSKRIPIVAMTAYTLPGDREKCIDSGMDDYLSKPVDSSELQRVLSTVRKQNQCQ